MPKFEFALTIAGQLGENTADALYEAGCDDATLSEGPGHVVADFAREAPSLIDAVLSAIAAVESVEGLEVLHVDPDELVWAAEIAQRAGRSRQSIDHLIRGIRGPGDFPAPAHHATRNPLWRWSEVEAWLAHYEGREPDTEHSVVLGAINGALQARHGLRHSASERVPLRKALRELIAS